MILLLVALVVVVAIVVLTRRPTVTAVLHRRTIGAGSASAPSAPQEALRRLLEEWRGAGLLEPPQVAPILAYESAKAAPRSRIPMAAEAVGYVGSALVLAALASIIGQEWDGLAVALRVAVLAVPAIVAALVGWSVGAKDDPAFVRMGSVLWALAAAGLAGTMVVVFVDVIHSGDPPEHGGPLLVGAVVSVWAGVAYAARRLPLQQLVLFVAALATVLGVLNAIEGWRGDNLAGVVWGLTVWAFGAGWTALGLTRRLEPDEVARLVGPATFLIGAQIVRADAEVLGLWLGVASAVLLLVVGVWRSDVLVLLIGTGGLFQWAPQLAVFYLADAIGTEATLLVVGVLLLLAAVVFTRLYRRAKARLGLTPGGIVP